LPPQSGNGQHYYAIKTSDLITRHGHRQEGVRETKLDSAWHVTFGYQRAPLAEKAALSLKTQHPALSDGVVLTYHFIALKVNQPPYLCLVSVSCSIDGVFPEKLSISYIV